jgi:hypothetical protein
MAVPAALKVWRRTRMVVAVGIPPRVADGIRVQIAARATARSPASEGTGSGSRKERTAETTR